MTFNPDEYLTSTAVIEDTTSFDPDAYLSDFDPDAYLGITPELVPEEKKPGFFQRTFERGKKFISGLFPEGAPQEDPALTPQEVVPEGYKQLPILTPEIGQVEMTPEEQVEVAEFQPKQYEQPVTPEDKKRLAAALIESGDEDLLGKFVQKSAAFGRGVLENVPGVGAALGEKFTESPQAEALKEAAPITHTAGGISAFLLQAIAGGTMVGTALSKTAVSKSPVFMNTLTRAITTGGITATKQDWEKDFNESLVNTLQGAGAGAVSIVPEIIGPANAWQLILQPIAGAMYDVGSDVLRGKTQQAWKDDKTRVSYLQEKALNAAMDLGFSIRDVSSGAIFKAGQKAQRAEIKSWMGSKGEKGFEIVEGTKFAEGAKDRIETIKKAGLEEGGIITPEAIAKGEVPVSERVPIMADEDIEAYMKGKGIEIKEEATEVLERQFKEVVKPPKEAKPTPEPKIEKPIDIGKGKEYIEEYGARKEPTPESRQRARLEREKVRAENKDLDKEFAAAEKIKDTRLSVIEEELPRVEVGSGLRKTLSKEFSGNQWRNLIGSTTDVKKSPEVVARLKEIAEGWNTARDEGTLKPEDPLYPLLHSKENIDRNWDADGVHDVIMDGLNVKDFEKYKSGIEGKRAAIDEEFEIAMETLGKSQLELESKARKTGISEEEFAEAEDALFNFGANIKDYPEQFPTGKREGMLETETGAVRTDLLAPGKGRNPYAKALANSLKRNLTTKGHFPEKVFDEKVAKDGYLNAELKEVQWNINDFNKATRKLKMTDEQAFKINEVLAGQKSIESLPKEVQPIIKEMRQHVDAVSQKLLDLGIVEGDLALKIEENKGFYLNRSYRVYDDPKWADKVPEEVRNRAKGFIRQEMELENLDIDAKIQELQGKRVELQNKIGTPGFDRGTFENQLGKIDRNIEKLIEQKSSLSDDEIEGLIEELLYKENAPINLISKGGKLGAKNLGILKRRKDIPAEIRALWGEYKNADVNYAKSVSKMTSLIANHQFLSNVAAEGTGKYFFDKPIVKEGVKYSVKISAEDNPSFKPLDGMYTTKELKQAFEDAAELEILPEYLSMLLKVNSSVKYAKTILSAMTHIRNVTGNVGFAIANGHWDILKGGNAIKISFADLMGRPPKELRAYIKKLIRLGVVGDGARAGEIRAVIKDATQGDIDVLIGTGPKARVRRALKLVEKVYGVEDDVWKIFAFENEMKRYRKHLPGVSEAELEKRCAKIVRDTYPTYSMIPRAVKGLRRMPLVGTFVSFPAEVMRTSKNTIGLAVKELADPQLRAIGAQRMSGIMIAGTITAGVTGYFRFKNQINRKKDEAARTSLPPWAENSQIIWLSPIEDGKATYIDLGYTDPHSYIKNPAIAALRGEDWESKIYKSAAELFQPFLSEEIMVEKILDVTRNKTKDGGKVYNKQDTDEQKRMDIIKHMADAIEPGTISSLKRIYRATKSQEGLYGSTYDVKTEAAALGTGVRISKLDVRRSLRFQSYRFRKDLIDASALARKRGVETSFESKKRIFDEFYKTIQDASITGVKRSDIIKTLKDGGIPMKTIVFLITGKYEGMLKIGKLTKDIDLKIEEKMEGR